MFILSFSDKLFSMTLFMMFYLIFHFQRYEHDLLFFIFSLFLKVIVISLEHDRAEDKDNGEELITVDGMAKVNDIDDDGQTFSYADNKSRNVLFIKFDHLVNDNLAQRVEDRQHGDVSNDLFMG
jgi:hypothetical protein